ncbi:ATP-binding cassette domain-containing protein [Paenibacillus sp. J22TS3]|uniref:ATP-binding cassette domain-containing protein n=1 Tax=Paenibacillus sp. J22TS3 TaxID=2807192 RepID=UPI001B162DC2|nr:ATP-binding cassette domain-containing protein [Paenibacillus sp. J22TS3]GIP23359.1 energy-coupling factor transporter ATP-binding protein EcfA2 [Paenibacillus sp. J22TS3]
MVLKLNHVSVNLAGKSVLKDVSCTIHDNRWISIIGQTGAGKSTFVKVLKGLIPDIQGEIRINEQPVPTDRKGFIQVNPDIGFVFQLPEHQIFETTVYKELAFAPKIRGYSPKQITEAIHQILPQVGLSQEILQYAPFQLSGGQRRRIAIASVLLMNPKVLILDEPTAGLDPQSRAALLRMFKTWQQQEGRTILFVSHHIGDVADYSDEVMLFHEGRLLEHLDARTLFLQRAELLEKAGLPLPDPIALLKLLEELTGRTIEVESCQEQDILTRILPIWNDRRNTYDQ